MNKPEDTKCDGFQPIQPFGEILDKFSNANGMKPQPTAPNGRTIEQTRTPVEISKQK